MKLLTATAVALLSCSPHVVTPDCTEAVIVKTEASAPKKEALPEVVDAGLNWSVHFSPNGGCEDAIVELIGSATSSVHLLAYGFTEVRVANALIAKKAGGHGLDVVVVLDRSDKTAKGSMASILKNGNVPVYIDSKHQIAHNKVIVVDGKTFETGSYNYTTSAEKSNGENCLIETVPAIAAKYEENFELHKSHSELLPFPN